jgi:YidC/Oxa1 family membrane protein insertase
MVINITVGSTFQGFFTSPAPADTSRTAASPAASATPAEAAPAPQAANLAAGTAGAASGTQTLLDPSKAADALIPVADASISADPYIYDNGKMVVTINPAGANVTSLKLKDYKDGNDQVEMIMPGKDAGLLTRIGGQNGEVLLVPFKRASTNDRNVVEYYRDFQVNNAPTKTLRFTKRYTFHADDYLFDLAIGLSNSVNEAVPLGKDGFSYTLSLGPQIGPVSSNIMQNQDFRRLVYLSGNDRKQEQLNPDAKFDVPGRVNWAAIEGKYFAFFLIPGAADFKIKYSTPNHDGKMGSRLDLSRPSIITSSAMDSYRIYAGPKLSNILDNYNQAGDNPSGQSGLNLDKVVDLGWLWWLESALKWLMQIFYYLIPNYGIAIILLTVLVKLVMYPLTKKSMESTSRMQALNPQMTEIREKYKDNPQKMNAEIAELYKREKINPVGGCLPILLQFPFFFAMYNLFYSHFDLRGALFIPGWIPDLSLPETLVHFSFMMPILNFNVTGLHLLPFLYLGSQFLSTKITTAQNAGASNGQMKFMMYGMPAIFFFVLYEVPSGLLVYWIFQNLLSILQQQFVNRHLQRLKDSQAASEPRSIIKPGQAGKNSSIIKGNFANGKKPKGSGGPGPKKTK